MSDSYWLFLPHAKISIAIAKAGGAMLMFECFLSFFDSHFFPLPCITCSKVFSPHFSCCLIEFCCSPTLSFSSKGNSYFAGAICVVSLLSFVTLSCRFYECRFSALHGRTSDEGGRWGVGGGGGGDRISEGLSDSKDTCYACDYRVLC